MSPQETAQIRVLAAGPLWPALCSKMQETVQNMLNLSLAADKGDEAVRLLHEARAAQQFSINFRRSVQADPQGE